MITKSEQRFINQWSDQKSGPRWKYYIQFSIAWTIVAFFVIFFFTKLFTNIWETAGPNVIYLFAALAVISGIVTTHLNYTLSEKKYKKIIAKQGKNNALN
jgi:uncharacterized membrane protein HdeD (DUF308 family)